MISLPWLRDVDGAWLAEAAGDAPIVVLDNHWHVGGQGDAVRAALDGRRVTVWGIDRVPACGSNEEVLREHGLDADSLAERLRGLWRTSNFALPAGLAARPAPAGAAWHVVPVAFGHRKVSRQRALRSRGRHKPRRLPRRR